MRTVFLILFLTVETLFAQSFAGKIVPAQVQSELIFWRHDSTDSWNYYNPKDKKHYSLDSLLLKSQKYDLLCKDYTFLSHRAKEYFLALQAAYLALRFAKIDSAADKIQNIYWSWKFKECK